MLWILLAMASATGSAADDRSALDRMAQGDQGGLAELYDQHAAFVYALAMRIVRDEGDAEEITQDVFVQAWRQSARFDASRGHVIAWLLMMTRARAIDRVRRRRARPVGDGSEMAAIELADGAPLPDEHIDWSRRASAVRHAVDALPVLQRLAVELAFFDGLTHVEIASQLDVPLGTVKTRVRQGLLKLRDSLASVA